MYVYIDESIFEKNSEQYYCVGALTVKTEVEQTLIAEALTDLRNDPDIQSNDTKAMDETTLSRGYFHATDDSKNAHSHLCRVISTYINGDFTVEYTKPHRSNRNKSIETIHRLNTQLVAVSLANSNEPISFVMEQRSSLSQHVAEQIIEDLFSLLDLGAYSTPHFPTIYPPVTVIVVDKNNPGIQATDFILWATVNSYIGTRKSVWLTRLKVRQPFRYEQEQGEMAGESFILNAGAESPTASFLNSPYPSSVFPLNDDYYDNVPFEDLYVSAEQTLHKLANERLPDHAQHLETKLRQLVSSLRRTGIISITQIQDVARTFIRLFDTVPIYSTLDKNRDVEQFHKLLHVRRCMGLILNGDIYGCPAVEVFKELRDNIIRDNRAVLFNY